jgi:predicted small lipoprotein YifL
MGAFPIQRILLVAALAASLAACGRAGDPELPPAAAKAGQAQQSDTPAEDKPFVLDPLI